MLNPASFSQESRAFSEYTMDLLLATQTRTTDATLVEIWSYSMKVVRKAIAYIVVDDRLVVFTHRDFPDAGLQVPAGTLRDGESPEEAVLREAYEETGLSGLAIVLFLGRSEFDCSPHGRDEIHDRFFFQLGYQGPIQESWTHAERHDNLRPPTWFNFSWMPVTDASGALAGNQGAFLNSIRQSPN